MRGADIEEPVHDPADLRKFVFEPGTVIAPHGFLVLDGTQVQPSGVQLVPTDQTSSFLLLSRTLADQPPEKSLQVVDANRFKLGPSITPVEMSVARFPDGGQNWVIARTPTKGAPNQFKVEKNVVLNEIMYRPYYPLGANWVPGTNGFLRAEDQGEYVEIYNRGSSPVNIGGWALTKGVQFEFPSGTTLPAGGYLVVARDPDYMSNYYGLPAAQVFGPWHGATVNEAVTLSGRDKKVELSDEIGNPVDGVHYFDGKSRWSKWADGRGSSLERIDPMEDGSQEGNWDASDESSKSEWKHYSWTGRYIESEKDFTIILLTRGIVLLDNLSVTDPSNPSAGNYIKNGDFEQPLKAPWTIDGSHIHSGRITYDRKDGEACLKIIATGRGNNRIDCIRYLAPQFPRNKDLLVEFDAKWITGYGILQFSGTWNTFAHSFHIEIPQKLGSPGRENSVHARLPSGNQGPLIQQVRQQPVLPGAGQDVVVTAGSIPTWLDPQGKAPALDFDVNDGSLAWTTTTHWKTAAAVPVVNGINILDLVALDQDAIVIGSAQLVVTYNLNWSAPQVTSVEPSQGSVAGGTPVTIHGSSIHAGARVFFATALAALNSLDEAGGTVSVTSPPGTLGPVDVKVVNLDGQSALLAGGFTYLSTSFNRGDVNSSRTINLTDAILILRYSFGSQALPCLDAADVNDDGTINITDPIVLLNYLFLGGGPPAAPFDPTGATFGPDPTPDALPCSRPKPGWTTGIGSKVDWGSPDWHASDRMLCHGRLKEINCRPHLDHYFGRGVAAVHPQRDSRCGLGLGPGPCCRGGPDPRSRGHR